MSRCWKKENISKIIFFKYLITDENFFNLSVLTKTFHECRKWNVSIFDHSGDGVYNNNRSKEDKVLDSSKFARVYLWVKANVYIRSNWETAWKVSFWIIHFLHLQKHLTTGLDSKLVATNHKRRLYNDLRRFKAT